MNSTIQFIECDKYGYAARTVINASADATVAIAIDFTTAGERLTEKAVKEQKKHYISLDFHEKDVKWVGNRLMSAKAKTVNIAGNGIYTFREQGYTLTQSQIDKMVYDILFQAIDNMLPTARPTLIRSGGQTGIDEAGLKAAVKLGIPALCLAPREWLFRDINSKEIANEKLFKARFDQ